MIDGFKYSREEIVKMIKEKCERTKEGVYWTPNISAYLATKGLCDDKDYYYEREGFLNKVYFTKIDFEYFLSNERKNNYYYDTMKEIDKKFIENNYDTFGLKLKNKVKPYDFTVEELLNSYIYMRYASFNIK